MFQSSVLKIESDEVTAIEVLQYLNELDDTLKQRMEDEFLSTTTAAEKKSLSTDEYETALLTNTCKQFFGISMYYSLIFQCTNIAFIFQWMLASTLICGRYILRS